MSGRKVGSGRMHAQGMIDESKFKSKLPEKVLTNEELENEAF